MEEGRSQELREQIEELEGRLENAARVSKMDMATIEELRGVIGNKNHLSILSIEFSYFSMSEGAWKQKDAAQIREQTAQDECLRLRQKLESSEEMVVHLTEKGRAMSSKRDDSKECERLNGEIKELNKRLQLQRVYTTEIEDNMQALEAKNKELLKLLDVCTLMCDYYFSFEIKM